MVAIACALTQPTSSSYSSACVGIMLLYFTSILLVLIAVQCSPSTIIVNFPTPYQVINTNFSEFSISISVDAENFGSPIAAMTAVLTQNGKFITSSDLSLAGTLSGFPSSFSGIIKVGQNISGTVDLIVTAIDPISSGQISSDPVAFIIYPPIPNAIYLVS